MKDNFSETFMNKLKNSPLRLKKGKRVSKYILPNIHTYITSFFVAHSLVDLKQKYCQVH